MRTAPAFAASQPALLAVVPLLLLALSGCSQSQQSSNFTTAALGDRDVPPPAEPPASGRPAAWNGNPSRIETGSVSPPAPATAAPPASQRPITWQASPRAPEPSSTAPAAAPLAGHQIEVRPGETLYMLSRRHGVPVMAFVDANRLASIDIKAGQRLTLPVGAR